MSTLTSLMQDDYRLTVDHVRRKLATNNGRVVAVRAGDGDKVVERLPYRDVDRRIHRLAHGLRDLGVRDGERVGTLTWNSLEHLELFLAVPAYGAVLHTVNVRLFEEQLVYVIDHAEDRVLFVAPDLVATLLPIVDQLPHLRHVIVCGSLDGVDTGNLPGVRTYDELLASAPADDFAFTLSEEAQAAALCYTSGTTGNPKGVLYSHRSVALHATSLLGVDSFGVRRGDRILAVVPMFHVNAWGLPFAAALIDADLVLPGRDVGPSAIVGLVEGERATLLGGVPTVFFDLLKHVDDVGADLSSLREAFCGGSTPPESLMRAWQDRHDLTIVQAWGMTETSPVCTVSRAPAGVTGEDQWSYRTSAGRAVPWVDLRLVTDDGAIAPRDGETRGELEVRGPWIAAAYYRDESGVDRFHDGWLRTGDVATIDAEGYLRIVDRVKDVIKSGGEWISSVELEEQLLTHPDIDSVAVIGVPDPKWDERPLACVVLRPGATADADELRRHLQQLVVKWWIPETFLFLDAIPRTSVGKLDKRRLRASLEASPT